MIQGNMIVNKTLNATINGASFLNLAPSNRDKERPHRIQSGQLGQLRKLPHVNFNRCYNPRLPAAENPTHGPTLEESLSNFSAGVPVRMI
jgi:hypothetical protein